MLMSTRTVKVQDNFDSVASKTSFLIIAPLPDPTAPENNENSNI